LALQRLFLLLPFRRFSGTNSADVLHVCAGLVRSADGAPTASNLSSKDRISDSRSPLPACLGSRPQHGSTRTGCKLWPTISVMPSEILQCGKRTRDSEMEREHTIEATCRIRTITTVRRQGSEGERAKGERARERRQDKANWRSLAPCGRKGLSAHWFLQVGAAPFWHRAGCASAVLRVFLFDFNVPSDGYRNVRPAIRSL
jgi:hypothetical protein